MHVRLYNTFHIMHRTQHDVSGFIPVPTLQNVLPHGFVCFSKMSGQIVSDDFLQLLPPSSTTLKTVGSKGNSKRPLFKSLPLIECIVQRSKHCF